MEQILIDKSIDTPYVRLENGYIEIEGRSIPENVHLFYTPLYEWVEEYVKSPEPYTKIIINLEYTNSSSNKYINEMLKELSKAYDNGFDMKVFWKFEEDDEVIKQIGEDIESIINIPFKYMEYEEIRVNVDKITVKRLSTNELITMTVRYWESIKRNGHEEEYVVVDDGSDDFDDDDFDYNEVENEDFDYTAGFDYDSFVDEGIDGEEDDEEEEDD